MLFLMARKVGVDDHVEMSEPVRFSVLSEILRESNGKTNLYNFVKFKFNLNDDSFRFYERQINQFVINHDFRWKKKSKGRISHFQSQYGNWLQQNFRLENPCLDTRQKKKFIECSSRTKRRRIEETQQTMAKDEIEGAYLRNICEIDSEIVKGLAKLDARSKELILRIVQGNFRECVEYTPEEALALTIDLKLSKFQYELLHRQAKQRQADIYPPYKQVFDVKKNCYPSNDSVTVTEMGAQIGLQSLLNHTIGRIVRSCDSNLITELVEDELEATYKWGFDGASGQSLYKQVFQTDSENPTDESIMMVSLIPLQVASSTKVLWKNPNPSSTRLCRPIMFEFTKENKVTTNETYSHIQNQIEILENTEVDNSGKTVSISHKLHGSMFDGKSITHLTDGSTESCNVCNAKPSEMNNLELIKTKVCKEENYCYGISSLHCWIRFFECIIHIGYKIPIRRRSAYTVEHKEKVAAAKTNIQKEFRKIGLYIDQVRQGAGNSNDGNTARRFFADSKFAADATGVDENLIKRFRMILIAINSTKPINISAFRGYAYATAELYIELYDWYFMPPSVHKVLIHGADLMTTFDLPIGYFSEEAQEARNKDFRNIRENHSRKNSRANTNEDILHWLLLSSDPVINCSRTRLPKKRVDYALDEMVLFVNKD